MSTTTGGTGAPTVSGDPDALDQLARRCRHAAGGLRSDSALLQRAGEGAEWSGRAAREFARSVHDLSRDLRGAADSFDAVGQALNAYAADLRAAQQRARRVEQELHHLAGQRLVDSQHLVDPVADPVADAARAARTARYDEEARALRRQLGALADEAALAAGTAACRVRAAAVAPQQPPGLLDRLADRAGDWVEAHAGELTALSLVLKSLATVAGSLALVPALAPVTGPIAISAGLLALGMDAALAARRRASWAAVGLDAVVAATPAVGRLGAVAVREVRTRHGSVVVFRVEGDTNTRLVIDADRNVRFQGRDMLYVNVNQRTHAELYLAHKIRDGLPNARLKSFRVPKDEVAALRARTVAQSEARSDPRASHRVDETRAPDLFGLRRHDFRALQEKIVPGTGRIVR
jgi:uncharacterized protein YukE